MRGVRHYRKALLTITMVIICLIIIWLPCTVGNYPAAATSSLLTEITYSFISVIQLSINGIGVALDLKFWYVWVMILIIVPHKLKNIIRKASFLSTICISGILLGTYKMCWKSTYINSTSCAIIGYDIFIFHCCILGKISWGRRSVSKFKTEICLYHFQIVIFCTTHAGNAFFFSYCLEIPWGRPKPKQIDIVMYRYDIAFFLCARDLQHTVVQKLLKSH